MPTLNALYRTSLGLSQLQQGFAKADTDGSKSLSFEEFEAATKLNPNLTANGTAAATFASLDADGNKQLSANEVTQGLNLTSQVYSVLLQGQEVRAGNAFLTLLGSTSQTASLFGRSNDFSSLTSSLLGGGSASTALTSLVSGANANTTLLASLFDTSGSTATRLQTWLSGTDLLA